MSYIKQNRIERLNKERNQVMTKEAVEIMEQEKIRLQLLEHAENLAYIGISFTKLSTD